VPAFLSHGFAGGPFAASPQSGTSSHNNGTTTTITVY
jgi:hypothetical protein